MMTKMGRSVTSKVGLAVVKVLEIPQILGTSIFTKVAPVKSKPSRLN